MCRVFTLMHEMSFLVKFSKYLKALGLLFSIAFPAIPAIPAMSENQIPDGPDLSEVLV